MKKRYCMKRYILKNYKPLLFFTFTFLTLILINYFTNQSFLKHSINKHRLDIINYATINVNSWLEEKMSQMKIIKSSISGIDPKNNGERIKHILLQDAKILNFSTIYVGYGNNEIISSKKWDKPKDYQVVLRPWYKQTIKENNTTITNPYIDVGLKIPVVSICTPLQDRQKGVVCGIVELKRIKNEVLNIPLPFKGESFLIDEDKNIILHKDLNKILTSFICKFIPPDILHVNNKNDEFIYYYAYIEKPKWYIIAKLNKKDFNKNINKQFLTNISLYFISVLLFIFLNMYFGKKEEEANRRYQIQKKLKKEQDTILFQQSKMVELGEMIGAISHQWKQPLNSLSILLGNLLQFKKMDKLNDEVFEKNINQALKNTHYLAQTINTFRNFYSVSRKKQTFKLKEAIEETLSILEPYFKNLPIKIDIYDNEKEFEICALKNEFQQIITSLMLNSRYFLLEDEENNEKYIKIKTYQNENMFKVTIEDNACGIKKEDRDKLFKPFYTTKKDKGTGLGLYLSYLIAREKLNGELKILSYKNPTIFLLNIPKENF